MYKKIIYRANFITWFLVFVLISVIVACGVVYLVPEYKHATGNFIAEHMSNKYAEQKSTIVDMQNTIDENDDTIATLRSTITVKQAEIERLSSVNVTLTQEKTVLARNLTDIESELEELQNSFDVLDENYDTLLAQKNSLQIEYDDLFIEYENLLDEIALNTIIISSLTAEQTALQSQVHDLLLVNTSLKTVILEFEAQIVELEERIAELESELLDSNNDVMSITDYYALGTMACCPSSIGSIDENLYCEFDEHFFYLFRFEDGPQTELFEYSSDTGYISLVRTPGFFLADTLFPNCVGSIDENNLPVGVLPDLYFYSYDNSVYTLICCFYSIDAYTVVGHSSLVEMIALHEEDGCIFDSNNNGRCDVCGAPV